MIFKNWNILNKEGFPLENALDLVMKTESLSFVSSLQESRHTYRLRLQTSEQTFLFFFDQNNDYIGYLSAEFIKQIPASFEEISFNHKPVYNNDFHTLYISSFALNPEKRGKGNGRECFNLAMSYFASFSQLKDYVLLVNEKWTGARAIYQSEGFRINKIFSKVFPGEDSLTVKNDSYTDGILMTRQK